jgi:predicted nucleic acid-binding protein
VDTNVLLYTVDAANPGKQDAALRWRDALWSSRAGRLSWQVLNEFYANATTKLVMPPAIARTMVESYAAWPVIGFSLELLRRAWHWVDHAHLPYWDALILASAERAGCQWLLTEDFQDGRKYGSVRVVNPFRTEPNGLLSPSHS